MAPICIIGLGRGAGQHLFHAARGRQFVVDRRERSVRIGVGIALDPPTDAVQVEVEGGELGVGREGFADPPDIKNQRGFARQAGRPGDRFPATRPGSSPDGRW
jgi:hypothetical protein